MKKYVWMVYITVISCLMAGCSKNRVKINIDGFQVNTMAVHKDGKVQAAIIDDFNKDYYTKDILEDFVKEELNEYNELNAAAEDPLVSLDSLKVNDGRARLVLTYASIEDYATFNGEEADYLTLSEARSKGLVPDQMVEAETGQSVDSQSMEGNEDLYFVAVKEEYEMLVQGKILYYQNGALLSDNKIQTSEQGKETFVIFK